MFLAVILVASVFTSAHAQVCVDGAIFNQVTQKCVCAGGRKGNPDLCCYNSADQMQACYVAGDPISTSFFQKSIPLDFPCGTMLSSTKSPGSCLVNVFTSSSDIKNGAIYTSVVKIRLESTNLYELTMDSPPTPIMNLRIGSGQSESIYLGEPYKASYPDIGWVHVSYSWLTSLYKVTACDSEITFRLADSTFEAVQERAPGVCIKTLASAQTQIPPTSYACSLNQDVSNLPLNAFLEYAIQPMKNYIYDNGVLKDTTASKYGQMCGSFQDILKNKCTAADRPNAMKKCAFLLFQPTIRRCFFAAGTGTFGLNMMSFLSCLDTYCQGTKYLCDNLKNDKAMQSCAPSLMNCHTWPPYRRENSFVAGEDGTGGPVGLSGNENDNGIPKTTEIDLDLGFDLGQIG